MKFVVSKNDTKREFETWENVIDWLSNQNRDSEIIIKTIEKGNHCYTQWYDVDSKSWKARKE